MIIRKLGKGIIGGTLLVLLMTVSSHADGAKESINIAILPCTDVVMTFKKFHPLAAYLEEKTGLEVNLTVPRSFAEFEMGVKTGDMDFVLQDPHTYVRLAPLFDKGALLRALSREGAASQYGAVIVRRDSRIKRLEDLRGRSVMFGPRLSTTKWTAAKELFEKNGIDIDNDLRAYSNGGCCEDIAFNVYLRAFDAGVVCDHFLAEHPEKQKELGVEAKEMIVISRTELVPTRVFAARKGTDAGMITTVNQALFVLDKNKPAQAKILDNAEIGGFQESKDQDYDGIRVMIGRQKVE